MKYHLRLPLLLMFMLLCVSASWGGNTYYVSHDYGYDTNNGSAWWDAFLTIGKALQVAVAGDEIHVAGSPTDNTAVYRERITLKNGVKVIGGYPGYQEDEAADPKVYITIIDASGAGSVVTAGTGVTPSAVIDGFTIRNGRSMNGGGINCYGGSPTIQNCRIMGNTAVYDGYGYTFGGGIYCENASPIIRNNTIESNQTQGNYRSEGGGIFSGWEAMPTITGNIIRNNSVPSYQGKGGGIATVDVGATITNNIISNNTNDQISCIYSAGPLIACNVIVGGTNGVYLGGLSSPVIVINNTIVGSYYGIYGYGSTATISNNIIAFGTTGIYRAGSGTFTLSNNDVYGNTTNYSGVTPGTNDRSQDPCLVNRAGGDYHLLSSSPCRDTGNNSAPGMQTYDYEGQARINNGTVDIGADEYHIIRVSWDGDSDDSNHGANWVHPKRTIAGAIAASTPYSEIWVKQGTYYENISLTDAALLFGGFVGSETSRSARNWATRETIIDGHSQLAPAVRIESCPSSRTTIDGFTITGGTGFGGTDCGGGTYRGGGIYCVDSAPTISHNIIKENGNYTTQAGGVFCRDSAAKILNNVVMDNEADLGAGIYSEVVNTSSAPEIVNNTIVRNGVLCGSSSGSGGIDLGDFAGATIVNNIVAFNKGGILCSNPELVVHHHNCLYNNGSYSYELELGASDITSDPQFANDGYHIQPTSLCRNHGSDTSAQSIALDIDSADRIYGVVDIGADECTDCVWYDLTLTGPTQMEFPINTDVEFTATVWDPTIDEPVYHCLVDFVIDSGEIRSIVNGDGVAGEIDGRTTGSGFTGTNGTVKIKVRRSTRGAVRVFASVYGCFGTLEATGAVCFSDPNVMLTQSGWPMFMRDRKHTGMSDVTDSTPETLNGGVPTWTASISTPPALAGFARPCYDSSPVVASDKVIVGTWNEDGSGDVCAFVADAYGLDQGVMTWNARKYAGNSGMAGIVSTPCIANGKVYVGDSNGYVYCLNLSDGSPAWSSPKPAFESNTVYDGRMVFSSPLVFEGVVYVSNEANVVYAFDAVTGNRITGWTAGVGLGSWPNTSRNGTSSPAIAVTTAGIKYLFIGSEDCYLYRVRLGSTPVVTSVYLWSPVESSPTISDQHVYVGTSTYTWTNVHKMLIDPFNDSSLVSTQVQAEVRPTLAYDGANLFTGCDTGVWFYRLSADDLSQQTSFNGGTFFVGSAALTKGVDGHAGVVYVGNDSGRFYARDPWDLSIELGTHLSSGTNAWVRSSPAIAYVSDSTGHVDRWVFVTSKQQGGRIFAFKTDR